MPGGGGVGCKITLVMWDVEMMLFPEAFCDETWVDLGQLLVELFIWTKWGRCKWKKKKKAFFWEGRKGDFNLVKKARRCLKVKIIMTNIYWDLIR